MLAATYWDNKPINQNDDVVAQLQPEASIFHIEMEEVLVNLCFNYLLNFALSDNALII